VLQSCSPRRSQRSSSVIPDELLPKREHEFEDHDCTPVSYPDVPFGELVEKHMQVEAKMRDTRARVHKEGTDARLDAVLTQKQAFDRYKEKSKKTVVELILDRSTYEIHVRNTMSKSQGTFKGSFLPRQERLRTQLAVLRAPCAPCAPSLLTNALHPVRAAVAREQSTSVKSMKSDGALQLCAARYGTPPSQNLRARRPSRRSQLRRMCLRSAPSPCAPCRCRGQLRAAARTAPCGRFVY